MCSSVKDVEKHLLDEAEGSCTDELTAPAARESSAQWLREGQG